MPLEIIIPSFNGVFNADFPALESLMIASAVKSPHLSDALDPLLRRISASSKRLRNIYLENIDKPFIIATSHLAFWSKLKRITVRGHLEPVDIRAFSICSNLEFLSYSSELTLPSQNAQGMEPPFLSLKYFEGNAISVHTLERMNIPQADTIKVETIPGGQPSPHPTPHTPPKVPHIATVKATPACISLPKLETLCLSISTIKRADANHLLNAIVEGRPRMVQPKHSALNTPAHDKHLLAALKNPLKLLSLQLDEQTASTNSFFAAMSPASKKARGLRPILVDWNVRTRVQSEEQKQTLPQPPNLNPQYVGRWRKSKTANGNSPESITAQNLPPTLVCQH
jgi:hypothetical protein